MTPPPRRPARPSTAPPATAATSPSARQKTAARPPAPAAATPAEPHPTRMHARPDPPHGGSGLLISGGSVTPDPGPPTAATRGQPGASAPGGSHQRRRANISAITRAKAAKPPPAPQPVVFSTQESLLSDLPLGAAPTSMR